MTKWGYLIRCQCIGCPTSDKGKKRWNLNFTSCYRAGPHSWNKRHSPWVTFWRQPPVDNHKTEWLDCAKTVEVCENNNRGNTKVTFIAYHAFLIDPMDQYLRSTSYRRSMYSDEAGVNWDENRAYLFSQIFGALYRNDLLISKLNLARSRQSKGYVQIQSMHM